MEHWGIFWNDFLETEQRQTVVNSSKPLFTE